LQPLERLHPPGGARPPAPLRGHPPPHREALAAILVALGEVGLRHPEIREIDLNPVKIRPDGAPVAVDALIALVPRRG